MHRPSKVRIDLEEIHQTLMHIAKETSHLSRHKYNADDVRNLQEQVEPIDEQYKEGIFNDRDRINLSDDPYEHPGQGEIAHELDKVHEAHHRMLERLME